MYIIIVGAGKVGYFLAKRLAADRHTVAVIEKDGVVCEEIAKDVNCLVINGDGCDPRYLEEAGVSRADVVASVTGDDEDNLVVCQLSKEKFKVSRTVARINDPRNEPVFSSLGADVPIDATMIVAKIIEEEVSLADFVNLMSFKKGKLAIVRVDLPLDSPVINKQVQELQLPSDSVLVSIIRGDEVIVPKGNTVLLARDDIVALTLLQNEQQLLSYLIGKL
jgi:trk system potassium uptake protein TrkA